MSDMWPMIHAERTALAETVAGLSEQQLATPSLCAGWSIQDLSGHIVATNSMTPGKFFTGFAKSGFNFNKMVQRDSERYRAGDAAALSASLAKGTTTTNHPPGPVDVVLGEAVIHGEDMRRPLGLTRTVPEAALLAVADFYKKSNLIVGAKKRISGVKLRATDVDWSNGDGPEASGPLLSLILVMTGRGSALSDLSGEGVSVLSQRV